MKLNYNKAEFTAAYGKFSQIPAPERIEIAFAGHSNVGKSTLINKLLTNRLLRRLSTHIILPLINRLLTNRMLWWLSI